MCAESGRGRQPTPDEAGHAGEGGPEEPESWAARAQPARAAASGTGEVAATEKRGLHAWGMGVARSAARGLDEPAARQIYSPRRGMPAPRRVRTGTVPDWWWASHPRRAQCETRGYYRPRRLSPDAPADLSLLGPSSLRLWFIPIPGLPRRWSRG